MNGGFTLLNVLNKAKARCYDPTFVTDESAQIKITMEPPLGHSNAIKISWKYYVQVPFDSPLCFTTK